MDAKEVKTHVQQLERATKENLPAQELVDILNALKKGVVPTESLLRETKVGMVVNRLKSHKHKDVSVLAAEIVKKWREAVQKTKGSKTTTTAKASTASPNPATTPQSPAKPAAKAPEPKGNVDPSKRNKNTDKVNYKVTGDTTRDNCVGMLYDGLCIEQKASPSEILELAKSLEQEVFTNYKRKIDMGYKRRIQSLYLNLKDKKNPGLRRRVVTGEISTQRLATMEAAEMASEERKAEDERIQQENLRKSMASKPQRSVSDQLTCGKCGQKKVTYTQAQTRSADEPMTTFCTCENCGHMWKFS